MSLVEIIFDRTINLAIIVALASALIYYYGRIILRSKKDLSYNTTSEVREGITFLFRFVVIPFLFLWLFIWAKNSDAFFSSISLRDFIKSFLVPVGLIIIQFQIVYYLRSFLEKKDGKIGEFKILLFILLSLFVNYLLNLEIDKEVSALIFLTISLMNSFLITTLSATLFNRQPRKVKIQLSNGRRIVAIIVEIGKDFIRTKKTKRSKKSSLINKSAIIKIEELSTE